MTSEFKVCVFLGKKLLHSAKQEWKLQKFSFYGVSNMHLKCNLNETCIRSSELIKKSRHIAMNVFNYFFNAGLGEKTVCTLQVHRFLYSL